MIVSMKKITIIVQDKDSCDTVAGLRSLGVLHIQHCKPPQSKDLNLLQEDLSLIDSGLEVLRQAGLASKVSLVAAFLPDWKVKARHIIELWKRHEHLQAYSRAVTNSINEWEPWGDFEPQEVHELVQKGIFVKLFQAPSSKKVNKFPEGVVVKVINRRAGISYCMAVSLKPFEIPFKGIALPRQSISGLRQRLMEDQSVLADIRQQILKEENLYTGFLEVRRQLVKDIELVQALSGMAKEASLAYVTGYVPQNKIEPLSNKAREEKWGLLIEEPGPQDIVPTLLKNPRWVDIISPVFKLLEIVPGYQEIDISPLFLIFLSLFFGMIIGDAGYGALYFILTFLMHRRFAHKIKGTKIFFLFYTFSACAVFWGLLTGTIFGQEWCIKAGFSPLMPLLNDTKFLQAFCFFLGALHLSLGHGWQAIRKVPSITAFSDVGWICVLWAAFFLAKNLILNDPLPFFEKRLIIAGVSMVILCTSPQKNILKAIGKGLGAVALSLVNNFTDVVSYVRLFAVGLAGIAIADTINALAAGFGANLLAKTVIIFLGHTINIILGPMSVLVHGVRLNVLEFSGHAGLSWSGIVYKPLKE